MHALAPVLSTLVLTTGALAQTSPATLSPTKVPGAVRHAGIYHVSSGTWTRTGNSVANMGPDTVYSNTAPSGYFSSAGGTGGFAPFSTNFDEGNLPGRTNTNNAGDRDDYQINGIEIGYCDLGAASSSGWELSFYSGYAPCTFDAFPDSTVLATGLPAGGGCWTMTLDLTGGNEICLQADGGDGFDDDPDDDSFGWSFRYAGTDGTAEAGFLMSGDPEFTDPNFVAGGLPTDGTNTYFGSPSLCGPDQATGLLTRDFFWLEDPTAAGSNCYFFGGYSNLNGCGGPSNPYASWHLELQADTEPCLFCSCGPTGCLSNPTGAGINATMTITGSSSIADDNVTLTADVVILNTFGFFITAQTPGFIANPGGARGNICLGPNIGRFQVLAMNSGATGTISISTSAGQWSVQSIPDATGPYAAMPGDTAYFQCWFRENAGTSGVTSNFTDGASITWLP